MNKLVQVKELLKGDEIIISAFSKLKYMKILKTPTISKTKKCWLTKSSLYSSVRCSIRKDDVKNRYNELFFYKDYIFEQDISKHNHKINIDLNNRDIFLVKREEPKKERIYE